MLIDMDPKHLFYLSEIIRYGSLSRASERLGVVQPTLTRIVKILEDRTGAPVLRRGRYGVNPTELGERLAETGKAIARQMEHAEEAVDQWRSGLSGELRAGIGPMLAVSVMPAFIRNTLESTWPYALRVTTATAGRLVQRLNNGELDVAIAPLQLNLHQERLHQETILEDRMAVFAGARSPLLQVSGTVDVEQLASGTWIRTGARASIYEAEGDYFEILGIRDVVPKVSFTGDISMALALLKSTDVLIALPENLTAWCPDIKPRQKLKIEAELPRRDIALWMTNSNKDRPEILHFRHEIEAHFKNIQEYAKGSDEPEPFMDDG